MQVSLRHFGAYCLSSLQTQVKQKLLSFFLVRVKQILILDISLMLKLYTLDKDIYHDTQGSHKKHLHSDHSQPIYQVLPWPQSHIEGI